MALLSNSVVGGYQKKTKEQLLAAIDGCKTISQLFALIQSERIVIQMHAQSGASNLRPKKLSQNGSDDVNDTPLERLKVEVRKAVNELK